MTTGKRQALVDFLYYSICQGQKEIGPIGYSPLPVNLVAGRVPAARQGAAGGPRGGRLLREHPHLQQPHVRPGSAQHQLSGHHRPAATRLRQDRCRSLRGRGHSERHRRYPDVLGHLSRAVGPRRCVVRCWRIRRLGLGDDLRRRPRPPLRGRVAAPVGRLGVPARVRLVRPQRHRWSRPPTSRCSPRIRGWPHWRRGWPGPTWLSSFSPS